MERFFAVFVILLSLSACATQQEAVIVPSPSAAPAPSPAEALNIPGDNLLQSQLAESGAEITRLRTEVQMLRKEVDSLKAAVSASPAPTIAPAIPPAAASTPTPASRPAPKSASTAAVKPAAEAKTDQTASPPAAGTYGVHLASYRSKALAVDGWKALQRKYGDRVRGFKPHVTTLEIGGSEGTYYRLIVGPLKSHADATTLCDSITAEQDYCVVTAYSGVPLE